MVGSMVPVAVKCSGPDRRPYWKIHTTAPNVADSDSTFITIALTGSTIKPNARNSSTKVAATTTSAIHGSVRDKLPSSSTSCAVWPPTATRAPAGGATSRTCPTMARACDVKGPGR